MATPEQLFGEARMVLMIENPFFGFLALRLSPKVDTTCETAWTDGESIGYNPEFFSSLSHSQRVGLLAHEVLHVANGHTFRRDGRDPKRWNQAADYAINQILQDAGLDLPKGGLLDPQYKGMSAEAIFSLLPAPPPDDSGGKKPDEKPDDKPGEGDNWGEVRDSPDPTNDKTGEAAWQQAVVQAAIQQKMRKGDLSADLTRLVNTIKKPPVSSLIAALQEFVAHSAKEDYSWKRPNTRFIPMGLYLPCLHSEELPPIAAVVDTSGSISESILQEFVGALQTVLEEAKPQKLTVVSADASVKRVTEYEPGDTLAGKKADFPGGGGTNFTPALTHLSESDTPPICTIYLTDLMGSFPPVAPDYPVLWVVYGDYGRRKVAPFGQTIYLRD